MTHRSPAELLALHGVRIAGFADTDVVASRGDLDVAETERLLGEARARGWVEHTSFAGSAGWSLTAAGRRENERLLARELAEAGCEPEVRQAHEEFVPLNARLLRAVTDWQLVPDGDRLTVNDHSDADRDARVLAELADVGLDLAPLAGRLARALHRFGGYDTRFFAALRRAQRGEAAWVDGTAVDSCHRVWFELHEDLLATLGLDRGAAT